MTSAPVARRVRRSRPAPARLALAAALGVALTGCGAGLQAQTYLERTVADGTNSAVGAIAVRNVQVLPPAEGGEVTEAGDDALVGFVLTNDGPEDDRLVEITSPAAASVQLVQGDGLEEVDAIELPRLSTTGNQYGALLQGLQEELRSGQAIALTMRFERAGEVELTVPVATTGENDFDQRERSENFHPIGEHGGEGEHGEEGGAGLDEASEEQSSSDH